MLPSSPLVAFQLCKITARDDMNAKQLVVLASVAQFIASLGSHVIT